MPRPRPAVVPNRTKMKKAGRSLTEVTSLPSTSKEPDKNIKPDERKAVTNSLPHILPLSHDSKTDTVKFIQISPIKTVPDQEIPNLIKLNKNPVTGLNLSDLQKLQLKNKAFASSNVKILIPVNTIKPPTSKITYQSSQNEPMRRVIPSVLQKRALLGIPKKVSEIAVPNNTTDSVTHKKTTNEPDKQNPINNVTSPKIHESPKKLLKKKQANSPGKRKVTEKQTIKHKLNDKAQPNTKEKKEVKSIKPKEKLPENEIKSSELRADATSSGDFSKEESQKKITKANRGTLFLQRIMYVADGFKEDVETFLEKCLQIYNLNFEKFCDIWKQMDFPRIFHGRHSSAEVAELSEEVIHIAKSHMVARNASFEENIAGLFLVYALLNHQPFPGFAALRLVPEDAAPILQLEAEARRQKRHDVLYVLGHVLIKGPCQFHVMARETSLEAPIKKYYDGTVQVGNYMDTVFTRNSECVPNFKEVMAVEQRYQAMRQKLKDRHGGKDRVSNLCKRPAAMLFEEYRKKVPCERDHTDEDTVKLVNEILETSKPGEARATLLRSIKERAMTNAVDTMKHLTAVEDRQDSLQDSSAEESDVEIKPSNEKLKVKNKGRSTATMLQELFGLQKKVEHDSVPEPSTKEMPTLDDADDLTDPTETVTKQISKEAANKANTDDDSTNNNQPASKKLKNVTDSPAAKRKPAKNNKANNNVPNLDQDTAKPSEVKNPELDNTKDAKNKKVTENISVVTESLNQGISDMPSVINNIDKNVDAVPVDGVGSQSNKETKSVAKSTAVSKDVPNITKINVDNVNNKSKTAKSSKKLEDENSESIKSMATKESSTSPTGNTKESKDVPSLQYIPQRRKKAKEKNTPEDKSNLETITPKSKITDEKDESKIMSSPERNTPRLRKKTIENNALEDLPSLGTTPKSKMINEKDESKNMSSPKVLPPKKRKIIQGTNESQNMSSPDKITPKRRKLVENKEAINLSSPEKTPKRRKLPEETNKSPNNTTPKRKITEEKDELASPEKSTPKRNKSKMQLPNFRRESPRLKNQAESQIVKTNSPSKKKNKTSDKLEIEPNVKQRLTSRVKSSFKKLGLSEIANDNEVLLNKTENLKKLKTGLRNKKVR